MLTAVFIIAGVSLMLNALLLGLFLLMRNEADNARYHADLMAREYMNLRRDSHRRDPKTGRFLPRGK